MRPSVPSPTGTLIGPPVLRDRRAAHQTVGRAEREAAHLVVAELVLHFERQLARLHRRSAEFGPCAAAPLPDALRVLVRRGRATRR